LINEEKLLPHSKYTRPQTVGMKKFLGPKGIALHWWEKVNQTLEGNWGWFFDNANLERYGSANVTIKDGIIRMVPDLEYCWHVGSYYYTPWAIKRFGADPGAWLLSVEMGHLDMNGKPSKLTEFLAEQVCAKWCYEYDLDPFEDIMTHWHITYKCTRNGPCHKFYVEDQNRLYGKMGFCEKVKGMIIGKEFSFA